jgi:nicotinate-nucleotide adenylyltransferase
MLDGVSDHYLKMPHTESGMAIGLFGGSFNPPHAGHLLLAEIALKRLELDQIWWIVTPGNPLKDLSELAPLKDRLAACEAITQDPRIKVTAFEAAHRVRYTADTLEIVKMRNADVNFVWLMGADNLKNFHKWQRWEEIAQTYPIAVIDRPGSTLAYLSSKFALAFEDARIDEDNAQGLARRKAPAWTFIHGPRSNLSSTALRKELSKN